MKIRGKVALVTGGAHRVGRTIGLALAREGAAVAVHYLTSAEKAGATAEEIRKLGAPSMTVKADLTREDDVARMVDTVAGQLGSVDMLINNAAVFFRTPVESLDEAVWNRTLEPNLKGTYLCSIHAGRRMLRQESGGAIVNIADEAAVRPYGDYIPYCVSKAGVVALTRALAKALAPKVRVNAVGPGLVLAPMDMSEELQRQIADRTPLKKNGTPEDVATAVMFLLANADFVTGAFLPIDGGRSLA